MERQRRVQLGVLVLRVAFGMLFFLHGWAKLFGNDISFVQEMLGMAGWSIPAWVLLILAVFELIAGVALVTGVGIQVMAWLLAFEILVAVVLFHARQGFFIVAVPNVPLAYGFEYHVALLGGLVCLALAGPGKWSLQIPGRGTRPSAPEDETGVASTASS